MLKVNNKDTRTTPIFTPCSSVSIVNFKHFNAGWARSLTLLITVSVKYNLQFFLIFMSFCQATKCAKKFKLTLTTCLKGILAKFRL